MAENERHARTIADSLLHDCKPEAERDALDGTSSPLVELLEVLERRATDRELRGRARVECHPGTEASV